MAELTVFSYQADASLLHRIDPRVKLVGLMAISSVSLATGFRGLLPAWLLTLVLLTRLRLAPGRLIAQLRYFLFLLILVGVARALTTPGMVWVGWRSLQVTHEGIAIGALICARLGLVVMLSLCLMTSTRSAEIRSVVHWFLRPIPWVPHRQTAMMIGLVVRFVPVIFQQAQQVRAAAQARGLDQCRNPVRRITAVGIALLRKTFLSAHQLTAAMASRSIDEFPRCRPLPAAGSVDGMAILVVVVTCALMLLN